MGSRLNVFVSSVQKELENERIAVTELVASDPFLDRHVRPVLFEQMPGSSVSSVSTTDGRVMMASRPRIASMRRRNGGACRPTSS